MRFKNHGNAGFLRPVKGLRRGQVSFIVVQWEDFARLVLEAAYEATICTAIMNAQRTGNKRVFLTLLGRGAFGNETHWIMDSICSG